MRQRPTAAESTGRVDAMLPGPAISPLEALARLGDAPVIALLHGSSGATLVWHDDTPGEAPADPLAALRWACSPTVPTPTDAAWGTTWADVPVGATLVQLDYEFPRRAPLLVRADPLVRWDADGRCTLHGRDGTRLARMAARLATPAPAIATPRLRAPMTPAWDADGHRQRVDRIRAWIASGDCYQANLAVPFSGALHDDPQRDLAFAIRLLSTSPAPFAAFFRAPGRASVISHSPECLLAIRGERMATVPIKGTRRRLPGRDAEQRAALRASPKDRAELAMIVDLMRNDLGRVAEPGSVRVVADEVLMDLPYVHHRAARIEARRRADAGIADALLAAFPAGSITGAPKRRAMEILAELEGAPRGPYCGTFGWVGTDAADLAVAIRTATCAGTTVGLHAGGGIVWDSDGAAEWDEAQAKASGLVSALAPRP